MNCEQAKPLIEPYADGEMSATGILELERHLHDCAGCSATWRNLQSLKKGMKADALYFSAPAELRWQISAELYSQTGEEPKRKFWTWNWLKTATSSVALACFTLLMIFTVGHPFDQRQLAGEIVSSHIRSLMVNHAMDVASTDQHTVKPWFDGKIDFAPPVKDLAAQEFPLVGGRLDYLNHRTVAALVFQRHKHVINLFIWPAAGADSNPIEHVPIQGYNLVHWSQGGMNFWAVSDLNSKELFEFAEAFRK
jgi:anti-sigma factor RsiW